MDIHAISDTIGRALTAAGIEHDTGRFGWMRKTIDDALRAAGLSNNPAAPTNRAPSTTPVTPPAAFAVVEADGSVIDAPRVRGVGDFSTATHQGEQGSLRYKLYRPGGERPQPMPLIVMLHGCKQDADDFAAGTRMNELAERHGFLVAYPEQTARANGGRCWNWFEPAHQGPDGAEPALIAGIVREIVERHAADPRRVYVAGLSAGAAMAVILGGAYPEVFAGVAAHSGLPVGAAHDVASAFAAMQGGSAAAPKRRRAGSGVPTIVFHGDADATVTISNGQAVVREAIAGFERDGPLERVLRIDTPESGRRCTATEFTDESGRTVVEEWVVHGAGHAWFGGSPAGSYTDPTAPDASAEIVRFFLQR